MDILNKEKIQRFEEFIDRRLKPDLVKAISERDKVFEQQNVFSDLRKSLENLEKNSVTSVRSMINLGSEVYAQADVLYPVVRDTRKSVAKELVENVGGELCDSNIEQQVEFRNEKTTEESINNQLHLVGYVWSKSREAEDTNVLHETYDVKPEQVGE
ncbi:hypothetical protein Tco_1251527 [Tanacetum coccineum]